MATLPARSPSEILRRGYSDEEISHIYELGRLHLENGNLRRAEAIFQGLTEVAPDFPYGWLGMSYIHVHNKNFDAAGNAARQAVRAKEGLVEGMLFLISCLLVTGDINAAGTLLGEVGEIIENGEIDNPNVVRFYRAQLARYQSR